MRKSRGNANKENMNNSEHNVAGKSRGRSKVVYGGTVDSSSSAMLQRASETDNVEEREEIFSKCRPAVMSLIRLEYYCSLKF